MFCEPEKFNDIAGHFHSIDIDDNGYYEHNINCSWKLSTPVFEADRVIEICLYDVDIPSNDNCSSDHLLVSSISSIDFFVLPYLCLCNSMHHIKIMR